MPVSVIRRVVGIILFFAALAGLLVAVQIVPEWQVRRAGVRSAVNPEATKPSDLIALQNEMRKTVLQALGGAFAILALYLTYRRVKVSEQGQITDRFTKAIEQLGALTAKGEPNIEVRLGAIYALERIAQDSPRDHWTIMEVLTAYVRRNAPAPTEPPTEEENRAAIEKGPSTEIQAILTVLGRRKRGRGREQEEQQLDLQKSDLRRANFQGLHLEGAIFYWAHLDAARFNDAHMEGVEFLEAHMEKAIFIDTHLEEAHFNCAHVGEALFYGAHVEGAWFGEALVEGEKYRSPYSTYGLTVEQLKFAEGWDQAVLDTEFFQKLKAAKEKENAVEPPSGGQN